MKVYEVFIIDVWNDIYQIGYYKDLDDSINDINDFISNEKFKLRAGDLKEYPSTFCNCFDTELYNVLSSREDFDGDTDLEDDNIEIRGFILDSEDIKKRIGELENEDKQTV